MKSEGWLELNNRVLLPLGAQPKAAPVILSVVEQSAHTVPLLQRLGEDDVEAGVELGRGLVLQGRGRGRSLDEQELGEEIYEGFPDPGSHLVSCRGAEIYIENTYSNHYTEGDEDHGEQQILKITK